LLVTHITAESIPALKELMGRFSEVEWAAPAIAAAIKETITKHGIKMPKIAMPLRVMLVGQTQTPSVDAVVALFPRMMVLERMARHLK